MKKYFMSVVFIFFFALSGISQEASTEIEVKKVFGGYNFLANGEKLKVKQLVKMMEPYQPAYEEMKSARTNLHMAGAVSFTGGFIVGWQLGKAISGETPKWGMVALGTGIALVSIPLTKNSFKKAIKAVGLYNSSLKNTSFQQQEFQ
jgi:hypothetical protein